MLRRSWPDEVTTRERGRWSLAGCRSHTHLPLWQKSEVAQAFQVCWLEYLPSTAQVHRRYLGRVHPLPEHSMPSLHTQQKMLRKLRHRQSELPAGLTTRNVNCFGTQVCQKLPREVAQSLSFKVFQIRLDKTPSNLVWPPS